MLGLIRRNPRRAATLCGLALLAIAALGIASAPGETDPPEVVVVVPVERVADAPVDTSRWLDASIPAAQRRPAPYRAKTSTPLGIVGGTPADWRDHPGAIRMLAVTEEIVEDGIVMRYSGQLCGGTAIHRSMILTAAHCVEGDGLLRFDIWFGANEWRDGARTYGYEAAAHPAYRAIGYSGDAAIVYLAHPLPVDFPLARLATPAEYNALAKGDRMVVRGWGTTRGAPDGGRDPADALQEVVVKIHEVNPLQSSVVSADGQERNACQGDSGGGMVREGGDPGVIYGPLSTVQPTAGGVCVGLGYVANYTSAAFVGAL